MQFSQMKLQFSPSYTAMPFDITGTILLVTGFTVQHMSSKDLTALDIRQLEKRPEDITKMVSHNHIWQRRVLIPRRASKGNSRSMVLVKKCEVGKDSQYLKKDGGSMLLPQYYFLYQVV